jgi:hypothetical protein
MKRWWLLAGLALVALAVVAPAQEGVLQGYVRDDLELISQESLPAWSARWTGPIEAATILAWLAENGYGQFVRDFNGDGVVDELDTIQLADDMGRLLMFTETQQGTTDARLVLGLAQYVAGLYPNEFVLKIYDVGFPSELLAEGLGAYSPTMVPGILIEVKPEEPNIAAYEVEMDGAEGVILGLNTAAGENNTYLAGRSYLFESTTEGTTPIDLAWSEEDRWQSGFQGQVLETVGQMSDQFYLDFRGQWTPVEFMLALSPQAHHESYGSPAPCPESAIAYDVTESVTPYGRVRIAECVTRETIVGGPTLDTYTYSVTNVSFQSGGCGICAFFIPDTLGLTTVDVTGPDYWMAHAGWAGWWWKAPNWSCGIPIGLTGVFSFTVVGPTFDTPVTGAVGACSAGASPKTVAVSGPLWPARTTGPGKRGEPDDGDHPGSDCADLTIELWTEDCTRSPTGGGGEVTVVVKVTNIGSATSDSTFLRFESSLGNHTSMVTSLDPGESVTKTFSLTFTANHPPSCPFQYTATVDPYNTVIECDEENNVLESSFLCPWCIG